MPVQRDVDLGQQHRLARRTKVATTSASGERRPRFQELGNKIGPIEETQLRRLEIGGARHGRQVRLGLTVVPHDCESAPKRDPSRVSVSV